MENTNIIEEQKQNLIVQRALFLFFYNFDNHIEIIEEMKEENFGFSNAWEELEYKAKKRQEEHGGMNIIDFKDFYELFTTKLSYIGQALLIKKVVSAYKDEVEEHINFSLEIYNK